MARWLSRIDPRRKKSKQRLSQPQQYEVLCRCGERTIGLRISRYQQVICRQCGEPLFVLPANVYPGPPPPEPKLVAEPESEAELGLDQLALEEAAADEPTRAADEPAPEPPVADGDLLGALANESKSLTRKGQQEELERKQLAEERQKRKAQLKKKRASEKAKAKKARDENPLTARVPIGQRLRRVFSPFRLVVASVIAIIIATVSWQIHSRNVESGRLRFDTARKKAMTFLEEQDFVSAEPLLVEAAQAADLIDRQDKSANKVRRLALETNVVNNLSVTSVYEALNAATVASEDNMSSVLTTQLGDRWIVLDTHVTPKHSTEDGIQYAVEMPLLVNGVLVEAAVVTEEFSRLGLKKSGMPIAFAAKIEACALKKKKGEPNRLVIQFASDSVRLWANQMTYDALGFSGSELPEHLVEQAASLGVSTGESTGESK
jgi:hypothetical protein